jgi:hypothetical protein
MPRSTDVLEKQPYEERLFDFDFDALLASTAETISSASISSIANVSGGSNDVTSSGVTWSGSLVQATFAGGTSGHRYLVTCRAITATQKLELEGILLVMER